MNVFRAEKKMIPMAGERVWRGAVELTTEETIRMLPAGKTDSSAVHMPLCDMLPHYQITYNDVISPNVLTKI